MLSINFYWKEGSYLPTNKKKKKSQMRRSCWPAFTFCAASARMCWAVQHPVMKCCTRAICFLGGGWLFPSLFLVSSLFFSGHACLVAVAKLWRARAVRMSNKRYGPFGERRADAATTDAARHDAPSFSPHFLWIAAVEISRFRCLQDACGNID